VVEELRVEKFRERNVVEGVEVESESRYAESISHISVADFWFKRVSDRLLSVESNIGTNN